MEEDERDRLRELEEIEMKKREEQRQVITLIRYHDCFLFSSLPQEANYIFFQAAKRRTRKVFLFFTCCIFSC
jgi:hypothetical protein